VRLRAKVTIDSLQKVVYEKSIGTIRYDTIEEFNVDWKAEYSALSSTRSQKKTKTNNASAPLTQYRLRSVKSVRKE